MLGGVVFVAGRIVDWYFERYFFHIILWIGRKFSCNFRHNRCLSGAGIMPRSRVWVFSSHSFVCGNVFILENT